MKLSFNEIKNITFGTARIWEEDGVVCFSKSTEKQEKAWYAMSDFLGDNSRATTGVTLDFHTNSSSFSFTATSGSKFEIYVNGLMLYNITENDIKDGTYSIKLDGKENRITLIMPAHCAPAKLSAVELDDGASVTPHCFDKKILFIGDSITQGWDSGYDSLSFAYRVSRFFNAESIIHGVGGGYFDESIFDGDLDFDPDIVMVAFGTNDWHVFPSLDALAENAEKLLGAIADKYKGKKVFAISPIWRADTESNMSKIGTFSQLCDVVKAEIEKAGMILIDGYDLVPHHTDFFADGFLHPNALGFGIYAENLIRIMQKYL